MTTEDDNPFDGFNEEESSDGVWIGVVVLISLLVLAFVCWLS